MEKTARAIIEDGNTLIFMERYKKQMREMKHYFSTIGGHLEENETFEEACIREVYEELGVDVSIQEEFAHLYNEELKRDEKYFNVRIISGDIGTGKGEEFSNPDILKYGMYKIVKIEKSKLNEYNIVPIKIKEMLIEKYS